MDRRNPNSAENPAIWFAPTVVGRELFEKYPAQAGTGVLVAGLAGVRDLSLIVGWRFAGTRAQDAEELQSVALRDQHRESALHQQHIEDRRHERLCPRCEIARDAPVH